MVSNLLAAQSFISPMVSRFPDLGAYSKNFVDIISAMNNQPALAEIKQVQAGVYGERRYMLKSMGFISLMLAVPAFSGGFGFQLDHFGSSDYGESVAGVAYGKKLGDKVNIGTKINYYMFQIAGYGKASTINFEMGYTWILTQNLRTGFHISNPVAQNFNGDLEGKLPFVFRTGLGYEPSEKFLTGVEAVKVESRDLNLKAVFQYKVVTQIIVRASIATGIESTCIAIGYSKRNFRLEMAVSYHQQLGFSPGLVMVFQSGKSRN